MVNKSPKTHRWLWTLVPCAVVLCLAAWLRGAEYDEQYTLFLTAGHARPDWPETDFPAQLARMFQTGHTGIVEIARDLMLTDVHPPLYFWLVSVWRAAAGEGLFAARLFSVAASIGALALIGTIARLTGIPPVRAILLALGMYAFAYTGIVARGFALTQLLLLGGVYLLISGRRIQTFAAAGALLGAAVLTNYLAVFVASAGLLALTWHDWRRPRVLAAWPGFLLFMPAVLWWFLTQRGSRDGQFPPFALGSALVRLARSGAGAMFGGLPLYVPDSLSWTVSGILGLMLIALFARVIVRWRHIGVPRTRAMFGLTSVAPGLGLLVLGFVFHNVPIEVRYFAFATPFIALLLAATLPPWSAACVLTIQAAAILGLILAPQTMQPMGGAARAASGLMGDGLVLLPRGNDGVGIVGAFAIEAAPSLRLRLIRGNETPDQIRDSLGGHRRVALALLGQDALSRRAVAAMRLAMDSPDWREVAHSPHIAVYERIGGGPIAAHAEDFVNGEHR